MSSVKVALCLLCALCAYLLFRLLVPGGIDGEEFLASVSVDEWYVEIYCNSGFGLDERIAFSEFGSPVYMKVYHNGLSASAEAIVIGEAVSCDKLRGANYYGFFTNGLVVVSVDDIIACVFKREYEPLSVIYPSLNKANFYTALDVQKRVGLMLSCQPVSPIINVGADIQAIPPVP